MSTRAKVAVLVVAVVAVVAAITAVAFSQGAPPMNAPGPMPGPAPMGPGMSMGPGMGMGMMGQCPVCGAMMGGMMGRGGIVAVDKAIYVMAGNQLIKYNQNLELVRTAEIKMDMARMHQMAQKMMEACPMRDMMMQGQMRPPMGDRPRMRMGGPAPEPAPQQ
jgi:hypothetical protein